MSEKINNLYLYKHKQTIGKRIELARLELNIPVFIMCNTLNVTEPEYLKIITGKSALNVFQAICFITETNKPLF